MRHASWLLATLFAVGMAARQYPRSRTFAQQGQGRKAMELEIKISKKQFIVKESLRIEVVVHNNGASAASVPAIASNLNRVLSYHLTGPSFAKEFEFHYARAGARIASGDPALETIPAGGKLSVPLSIENYWTDWKPGQHTLRATFKLGGQTIESNSLSFEILAADVKSGQVMADSKGGSGAFMRAVFLSSAGGVNRLYQGFFEEVKPDVDKTPQDNFAEAFAISPEATGVAALWADFDRPSGRVSPRYGWLNGHIAAVQELQSPPITFELEGERLLRPGLMTPNADALFVSFQGSHATLTRVPRSGAASKVWEATLPFSAADGRVWITAAGKPTAVFTAEHAGSVNLFLVQDGKVIASAEIEKAVLLPQSEPALAISADGTYRASVLVADPAQRRQIAAVEWQWKAGEPNVPPRRQPAATLAQDPRAAAVVYTLSPGVPRRDWVLLLGGGNIIVTSRSPSRPRMVEGLPLLPLQLLPRAQTSYLLVKHPKEVVYLAPMF